MKNISYCLLACIFLTAACCRNQKPVCNVETEKETIKLTLQKYIIANEAHNLAMIDELWANDTAVLSIGTDRHEIFAGTRAVKDKFALQFERFEDTFISAREQVIYVHPGCESAWFSEVLQYNYLKAGKAHEYPDLRFTGFMEKRAGKWVFIQTHLSAPND